MGIKEGTTNFELSRGLKYKFNGDTCEATHVVLREPSMQHVKFYMRLKQMIARSQMELAKQAGEIERATESIGEVVKPLASEVEKIENETELIEEALSLALHAGESVDLGQFMGTFEKMVYVKSKDPLVMVDDRVAMTAFLWNNLYPDDAFNMALRWCSFFVMPSQEGRRTISDRQPESRTRPMEV